MPTAVATDDQMTRLAETIYQANNVAYELANAHATGARVSAAVKEQVRTVLGTWHSVKLLEEDAAFVRGQGRVALENALFALTRLYALAEILRIEALPVTLQTNTQPPGTLANRRG